MSFTYNAASPSTRDKLRLLVGDTNEVRHSFENEELDTILAHDGELYLAAALACRVLATDAVKQAIFVSVPGVTITKSQIPTFFEDRARAYEKMAEQRATPDQSDWYTDTDKLIDAIGGRANVELELPGVASTDE